MAKVYDHLTDDLQAFIEAQQVFFVATAPLSAEGHINVSPKGLDCLRVLSPNRVAYLDLTGSGNETSAHLLENGRITFMFCSFQGAPRILRLYGQGHCVLPGHAAWHDLYRLFTPNPSTRQIIVCEVARVQTSCGFGVPLFEFVGQRDSITKSALVQGEAGVKAYQKEKNAVSVDGLLTPLGQQLS